MPAEQTIVYDPHGMQQTLGVLFASGGEGEIYPLQGRPEVLVKWYHRQDLAKRGQQLQDKVQAMILLKDQFKHNRNLSWPLLSVFDENKKWVGYAMYKSEGIPMFKLAHAMLYARHFPGLDRQQIVSYLVNLIRQIMDLHKRGVMIGDYNLNNILCTPGIDSITLIDCDSYQLRWQDTHYPCPVGSADMTPKEQQNQNFSSLVRTAESEAFSLAIILFKCLMLGRHPYDIVGGDDPVTNLNRGCFAYGLGNRGIPRGHWYNIWSHMPHRIKSLFIQTFTEGANDPSKRVSPAEWLDALTLYQKEITKGWHEAAIKPDQPKNSEYRGCRDIESA
ncbi:MAG: kinase [Amphritea sp.]